MVIRDPFFSSHIETVAAILAQMRHFIGDAPSEVLTSLKVAIVCS
jgi:hypothetical protein